VARVLLRTPAGAVSSSRHPHVTIAGYPASVTLPITRPEVDHSDLASVWEETDRPGREPILERKNPQLGKFDLTAILVHKDRSSIEHTVLQLRRLANNSRGPLIVSYGGLEAGYKRMTDLRVRVTQREDGTNLATQAEAYMEFSEIGFRPQPIQSTQLPLTGVSSGRSDGRGINHTVGQGETLASIGAHYGGHADFGQVIARANNISDPRSIKPGDVLLIPNTDDGPI
jgi:LysM repeat protein